MKNRNVTVARLVGFAALGLTIACSLVSPASSPAALAPETMQAVVGGSACGFLNGVVFISGLVALTGNPVAAGVSLVGTAVSLFAC